MNIVNPALSEAFELGADDVRRTTRLRPQLEDDDWMRNPGFASAMLGFEGHGGQSGVKVDLAASPADELVCLAKEIQEEVIDELWGAWPACPLHPAGHPLAPNEFEGQAVWVCPATGRVVGQVGRLSVDPTP